MKKGTTFSDGIEVKPLDNDIGPKVRLEGGIAASAAVTALEDPRFFTVRVITTAGSTVNARVPFFVV